MQLAALVHAGVFQPTRFTRIWPSTTPTWATIAEPDPGKKSAINHRAVQRSAQILTTVDTGLRRDEVGGIIIGVCLGLLLQYYSRYCFAVAIVDVDHGLQVPNLNGLFLLYSRLLSQQHLRIQTSKGSPYLNIKTGTVARDIPPITCARKATTRSSEVAASAYHYSNFGSQYIRQCEIQVYR